MLQGRTGTRLWSRSQELPRNATRPDWYSLTEREGAGRGVGLGKRGTSRDWKGSRRRTCRHCHCPRLGFGPQDRKGEGTRVWTLSNKVKVEVKGEDILPRLLSFMELFAFDEKE